MQTVNKVVSDAIKNEFPDIDILVNVPPPHYVPIKAKENKYFNSILKKYVLFPAIGAFEIIMDNNQIFSKKNTNLWPNVNNILDIIRINLTSNERNSVEKHTCPSLYKDQQEKSQKSTIIMADNMLKKLDESSTYYKKKKSREQTLAEQFRKYKMKKQAKQNLHNLYAECQQLKECKTSKVTEYDIKKLHEFWGKNEKIPTFIKDKGVVIQQHKGKKQVLIHLSSIDEEGELKLASKPHAHGIRNSKPIQNLQLQFEKLENKFVKLQHKVSQVNSKKFQLQYDQIYGKKSCQKNSKMNMKRYLMEDKVEQIKITYSPQKMLKQLKDKSNKKHNKIDQYIRSTEAQKNQKLGRIYGPQLLKQNISPQNTKRNKKSIKLRGLDLKKNIGKSNQEVQQQSEEQSEQKQNNEEQSEQQQSSQNEQQCDEESEEQSNQQQESQEQQNSQTNFTSSSVNQMINKYSIIRDEKRMASTGKNFHSKNNINQRKIYTSEKPSKLNNGSTKNREVFRNSRNSEPHKKSLYKSRSVQQKDLNAHNHSHSQQLNFQRDKSKVKTTIYEQSNNQNIQLKQNSKSKAENHLKPENQKQNIKFFKKSKQSMQNKQSPQKKFNQKKQGHQSNNQNNQKQQELQRKYKKSKQQVANNRNSNKNKSKFKKYLTKEQFEDNNSFIPSQNGNIKKIELQINKMKRRNKLKSKQFQESSEINTQRKRQFSEKKSLNQKKMVAEGKNKSKSKLERKQKQKGRSKRSQGCQTEQQKQSQQELYKNESKITKKKSKRSKQSDKKQVKKRKNRQKNNENKQQQQFEQNTNLAQTQRQHQSRQQRQFDENNHDSKTKIQNDRDAKSMKNKSYISNNSKKQLYTINVKEAQYPQNQLQIEKQQQANQQLLSKSTKNDELRQSKGEDKRKTADTATQAIGGDRQNTQSVQKQMSYQAMLKSSQSIQNQESNEQQNQQGNQFQNNVENKNLKNSSITNKKRQNKQNQSQISKVNKQRNQNLALSQLSNYSKNTKTQNKQQMAAIVKQFYGPEYQNYINQSLKSLRSANKIKQKENVKNGYKKINQINKQKSTIFEQNSISYQSVIDNSQKMSNLLKIIRILCMRNEYLIIRLFQNPQMPQAKAYGVWLCDRYQWKLYIVKQPIQINENGKPMYLYHQKNQLWPIILTEALAQLFESYERLAKASICELFHGLTGTNYVSFQVKQDPNKNSKLLKFISLNQKKNFIITAEKRMHNSLAEQQNSHAQLPVYYILSQSVVNDKQILLRMKKNNSDAFWIKLDKFVSEFSHVHVLQLRINHNFNCFSLPDYKNIGVSNFTIIQLNFKQESFGCVAFATGSHETDFRLFVYKQEQNNVLRLVGQAKQRNKKYTFFDCCFEQGKYLIFAELKGKKNKIAYLGEGSPQISLKQEIQQLGLKNNYTQYVPIESMPQKKQIQMPKFMAMTKKSEHQDSFIIDSGLQSQHSRIDKNKLKSQFIEYLIKH